MEKNSEEKFYNNYHVDGAEPFLDGFNLEDARLVALAIHASDVRQTPGRYRDRAVDLLNHISQHRPTSPDFVKGYLDTVIETNGQLWFEVKPKPILPHYIVEVYPSLIPPPTRLLLLN